MSFDARRSKLSDLLSNARYYMPRNQRSYVWGQDNWADLYEDIMISAEEDARPHFIGSIVLMDEGQSEGLDEYNVIDGQQRVVTITILLSAIMHQLRKRNMEPDFKGTRKRILVCNNKGQDVPVIAPEQYEALPRFLKKCGNLTYEEAKNLSPSALAKRCIVDNQKEKVFKQAYEYLSGRLETLNDEDLLAFRDAVERMEFVRISATSEEDAYIVFEILNARGMDLEDHELLKNYIMRYLRPEPRRDEAKTVWTGIVDNTDGHMRDFLRHYATHRYGFDSKSKSETVYKAIKKNVKGTAESERLLEDLKTKSEYYEQIIAPTECDSIEGKVLSFFKTRRLVVMRPLLLSLMSCLERGDIDQAKYDEALVFLRRFFTCYMIIGNERSNRLTSTITKYSYQLETAFTNKCFEDCFDSFRMKMPSEQVFLENFQALGWSKGKWGHFADENNKARCKLVLQLFEEQLSGGVTTGDFSIEHILPDAESENHSHIGNLLPLEKELNSKCGDKPLPQKLPFYGESCFASTRRFYERHDSFETFDVNSRTLHLGKEIWSMVTVKSESGN